MFKVNLEKELVKQNKSLVTAKELLLIKEHDRIGEISNKEVLMRVFDNLPSDEGLNIKNRLSGAIEETKRFNQERCFHISQIEKLCKKYYLKFLPSAYFKGAIDMNLPSKISQFEIAYDVNLEKRQKYSGFTHDTNSYIVAPKESFDLQEELKDPLLFYKINEEYFYLIHKWGNDLSLIRRVYNLLSSVFVTWLLLVVPATVLGIFLINIGNIEKFQIVEFSGVLLLFASPIYSIITIVNYSLNKEGVRFIKENDWRSEYL